VEIFPEVARFEIGIRRAEVGVDEHVVSLGAEGDSMPLIDLEALHQRGRPHRLRLGPTIPLNATAAQGSAGLLPRSR